MKNINDIYNKLKLELNKNMNGLEGAKNVLVSSIQHEIIFDDLSHEIDKNDYVLIATCEELVDNYNLDINTLEEIKKEYERFSYILPLNKFNFIITDNEISIFQEVEIYLNGDKDTFKARIF